jgi:hypothetical protein
MAAQNKRNNSTRKNKNMTTNTGRNSSPNSRDRGAVKSTPAAAASFASPKPTRQAATRASNADIATKAYEIWLSRGQETGNDQHHWFEAKRQLQQA